MSKDILGRSAKDLEIAEQVNERNRLRQNNVYVKRLKKVKKMLRETFTARLKKDIDEKERKHYKLSKKEETDCSNWSSTQIKENPGSFGLVDGVFDMQHTKGLLQSETAYQRKLRKQ